MCTCTTNSFYFEANSPSQLFLQPLRSVQEINRWLKCLSDMFTMGFKLKHSWKPSTRTKISATGIVGGELVRKYLLEFSFFKSFCISKKKSSLGEIYYINSTLPREEFPFLFFICFSCHIHLYKCGLKKKKRWCMFCDRHLKFFALYLFWYPLLKLVPTQNS